MTPLVNVLMGVVVFRERLRAMQWLAVAFAFAGVALARRSRTARCRGSGWRLQRVSAATDW